MEVNSIRATRGSAAGSGLGKAGRWLPQAVGGLCYSNNCSLDMKGVQLMGAASYSLIRTTQLSGRRRSGE